MQEQGEQLILLFFDYLPIIFLSNLPVKLAPVVCSAHATTAVAATEASISVRMPGLIPPVPA